MPAVPTYLENHEAVLAAFGHWIAFHDGNVLSLTEDSERVRLVIQGWIMTDQVDEKGYFVLKNHHLVTFYFEGISDFTQEGFVLPNILFELTFGPMENGRFQVVLESVMGPGAAFTAQRGKVASVVPCNQDATPQSL